MFISIVYMFRAAMCPSSGELIVSIRHLVYVTLHRWPFGVQVHTKSALDMVMAVELDKTWKIWGLLTGTKEDIKHGDFSDNTVLHF